MVVLSKPVLLENADNRLCDCGPQSAAATANEISSVRIPHCNYVTILLKFFSLYSMASVRTGNS